MASCFGLVLCFVFCVHLRCAMLEAGDILGRARQKDRTRMRTRESVGESEMK